MAAKFVVLLACLALSSGALVKREAGAGNSVLDDISKNASEFSKTFTNQLNELINSKDTEAFKKQLTDGSNTVLQEISVLSSSLQNAANDANGKAKEALEAARNSLSKVAEELRAAHPDLEQNANALKEKLQAAVQGTVQESQKLAQTVSANLEQGNAKLAPQLKAAYEDFVKQAQSVQQKLSESVNKQ